MSHMDTIRDFGGGVIEEDSGKNSVSGLPSPPKKKDQGDRQYAVDRRGWAGR